MAHGVDGVHLYSMNHPPPRAPYLAQCGFVVPRYARLTHIAARRISMRRAAVNLLAEARVLPAADGVIMNVQMPTKAMEGSPLCALVSVSPMMRGNTYFGRNLDWSFSYGETILDLLRAATTMTRCLVRAARKAKPNAVISVGVVMADRPMYFDCANEHGLAIAGKFPRATPRSSTNRSKARENVATFEFPLWVARNFDSVDEVEEALRDMTLVSPDRARTAGSLLHWFISDGKRSVVVEQMADGMHVHHGNVDVLTNQPTFDFHMENLRNYMCVGNRMAGPTSWGKASLTAWGAGVGMHGIPGDVSSPSRFVRSGLPARITRNLGRTMEAANSVAPVPHPLGSRADGGRHGEDGRRPVQTHAVHQRIFVKTNTYYARHLW